MTKICEDAFSIDLPGQWEQVASEDPGSLVYHEIDGPGTLAVMLLSVRPMFAIADKARMLGDYASHRLKYERGRLSSLEQSAPVFTTLDASFEATWHGRDMATGRQHRHRAVLADDLLADFCFESSLPTGDLFHQLATGVLSTVRLSSECSEQDA